MSDQMSPDPQMTAQHHAKLRELAAALRDADHLEPDTQKALASLLDEIGSELEAAELTSAKKVRLAEAVSEVARSLHEQ